MKIRLIEKGWERYNGDLARVWFEDGVSVRDVDPVAAMSLGAMIRIVEVNEDGTDGHPVSPAHELVKVQKLRASTERVTSAEPKPAPAPEPVVEAAGEVEVEKAPETSETRKVWTRAELEEIAEAKGINGVREIATPLDIKGTSIRGLVDEILRTQGH